MIDINELAQTLETKLNNLQVQYNGETLTFRVKTYADFLETRADSETQSNFIPVYIDDSIGSYEAIPNLLMLNQSYSINFYFPFEYKSVMYNITGLLASSIVGKQMTIGTTSGTAITNLSTPTFASINVQNMGEFENWCNNIYKRQVRKSKMYIQMVFTLYLAQTSGNAIYTNNVKYTLSYNGLSTDITRNESGTTLNNDLGVEQIETDNNTTAIIDTSAHGYSFTAFVDTTSAFWLDFLDKYNNGNIVEYTFTLTKNYDGLSKTYTKQVVIQNITENLLLGKPLSFSFVFADRAL